MYICVCSAVTDRAIHAAVAAGADSLDDLRIDLGVAMKCGTCSAAAENVICAARAKMLHLQKHETFVEAHESQRHSANDGGPRPAEGPAAPARVWPIFEVA